MSKEETLLEWEEKGFNDQEWGYPLLDHVWEKKTIFNWNPKYPKKYQEAYRRGQWKAYESGVASKPWFDKPKQR